MNPEPTAPVYRLSVLYFILALNDLCIIIFSFFSGGAPPPQPYRASSTARLLGEFASLKVFKPRASGASAYKAI